MLCDGRDSINTMCTSTKSKPRAARSVHRITDAVLLLKSPIAVILSSSSLVGLRERKDTCVCLERTVSSSSICRRVPKTTVRPKPSVARSRIAVSTRESYGQCIAKHSSCSGSLAVPTVTSW
ncbi:hypothetical protein DQ04_02021000 [Trypanosoma grayi]|uniref:hypothetical protein n=1 Tax=Trypanosoma grayi TaxID=71804 RepID=UPI0004F477AE|nr:hypothetical protein DQ04_02021000 [Trypanosoma grayi]KEG12074.1 hypothetical protein DQ04_02021000 [Trypanosoma grayi]